MDRLQAMHVFVRVAGTGSFSAARQLAVGQPAISKMIAPLESRLRVSLLLRTTHGLSATKAGQRFDERAQTATQEIDEAKLAARGAGIGLTGCLRLSAPTTLSRLHVMPLLPRFLADQSDLVIEIIPDDRGIDLVVEGTDVAFRLGELPDSAAAARNLATGRRSVMATPA